LNGEQRPPEEAKRDPGALKRDCVPGKHKRPPCQKALLEKRQEIDQDREERKGDQASRADSSPKSMDQFDFLHETVHLFRFLLNFNTLTPGS